MKTILVTVSPRQALGILNGEGLITGFKLPVPCIAYIGVCNYKKGLLHRNLDTGQVLFFKGAREIPLGVSLSPMNGNIIIKCEIKGCEPIIRAQVTKDSIEAYSIILTSLTVFDEPMLIRQFIRPDNLDKPEEMDTVFYKMWIDSLRLNWLPPRWQYVEIAL